MSGVRRNKVRVLAPGPGVASYRTRPPIVQALAAGLASLFKLTAASTASGPSLLVQGCFHSLLLPVRGRKQWQCAHEALVNSLAGSD